MRKVRSLGKCIQCGNYTNVQLDCGKYACMSCLHVIGLETKRIRDYLKMMSIDTNLDEFIPKFLEVLAMMKVNNVTTVDNILKTITAIQYYDEYKSGILDPKIAERMQKQLDIFNNL